MHGRRIGQGHFIELGYIISDLAAVEAYHDFPLLQVHPHHLPDVAIVDVLVVVVDGLEEGVSELLMPR